mmetsp:Transcript_33929/g.50312  ORF Transcript_33929/g.50312 Transcript_33929/m.50312 type:complete len:199 (-) Transcript_33929:58-654(-)|eukprot:CAMPEP_0194049686 /NCGR_PEP_ID=MMETSP0009_2-20130614/30833_1 /TAXON_ID=210454 /ORGANISM="Grammatophora oceanica, Strain CCMP 410" /LENGTH=198 /DNA_ID=CAMNT_0038695897 /DNA_START=159 /DNA_END=755 /DNA_ORIENTATION=-
MVLKATRFPSFVLTFFFLVMLPPSSVSAFNIVLMGSRRSGGKNLDKLVSDSETTGGKGQKITGVTLPEEGKIKGWEFGGGLKMACTNVDGSYYAVQGECPRCAFDLWKGDLLVDEEVWEGDVPRVACPTCSTTYSFRTGYYGPPLKRSGLSGFVSNLAKTATQTEEYRDARAYRITQDDDGQEVYCSEFRGRMYRNQK